MLDPGQFAAASPEARLIFDRFHVQRLAHDALDQVRRQQWRAADADDRDAIKGTRFVLQKNPWNLSDVERGKLTDVQRTNRPLYRAYLLKETLARILDGGQVNVARDKLLDWIGWATRSRLPPFRRVARTIKKHIEGIVPPRWLLHLAGWASLVALLSTAAAGIAAVRAGYPADGREPDDVDRVCAAAQHPVEPRELRQAWPCAGQAEYRRDRMKAAANDLLLACARHWRFTKDLQNGPPELRTGIQQEAAEIARANRELRALRGSAVYPGQLCLLAELGLNLGLAMATMVALGTHANSVGIQPVDDARKIARPLTIITMITFGVSAAVTAWESLDPQKIDFDGNSYCMVASSFWLGHASVPLLSLVVGAQLATGWYATRGEHMPAVDATKIRWGVGPYVFFLEVWSFAAIVISGGTAAFWIRALAGSPLASARTEGMVTPSVRR